MKNKRMWIIIAVTLVVVIAGVIAIASISGKPEPNTNPSESTEISDSESTKEPDISIPDVSKDTNVSTESDETDSETIAKGDTDPEDIVKPNESETITDDTPGTTKPDSETQTPVSTAQPETKKTPVTDSTETQSPTIVIGGGDTNEKYSCGVAGHHCEGPETHAYISNLELEGCKYCGSHTCPSFYGTDAWGNAQYTPSLCPKYSVTQDPLNYCQQCGKPTGDGKNGTCVHYIQECDCPNCGKHVGSRECHTCE